MGVLPHLLMLMNHSFLPQWAETKGSHFSPAIGSVQNTSWQRFRFKITKSCYFSCFPKNVLQSTVLNEVVSQGIIVSVWGKMALNKKWIWILFIYGIYFAKFHYKDRFRSHICRWSLCRVHACMAQVFLIFDISRQSTEHFKEFHYLQLTI